MANDVIPISAVKAAQNPVPQPTRAVTGDTLGKDAFMKLLVAQLKYQNPMSPTDPTQMMAQTANFTMVEKLTQIADAAAAQETLTKSLAAAGLVGKTVEWTGDDGTTQSGTVTASRIGPNGPMLDVGDKKVSFAAVTAVVEAPPATAPTTSPPTSTDPTATAPTSTDQTPTTPPASA